MKKSLQKILITASFLAIFGLQAMQAQLLNTLNISANPNDCTNTSVTASGTLLAINIQYLGGAFTVNGNIIIVELEFSDPFIILPALGTFSHTVNLGNLPTGTYTLIVNTTQSGIVKSTLQQPLTITPCCNVLANIAAPSTQFCVGDTVTLFSATPNATTFNWTQNGNSLSTNSNAFLSFPTAGVYNVLLQTGNGNCNTADSVSLTVNDYPTVHLGNDTAICSGSSLTLDATQANSASYFWNVGPNTPTFTVLNSGTYAVTVTVGNCSSYDAIAVSENPTPSVNLGSDATLCPNETLDLDATLAGASYLWSDGSTNATLTVSTAGTYSVQINLANCTASDTVQIDYFPPLMFDLTDTTVTFLPGDSVQLDAGVWASYLWTTGETTPQIYANASGSYGVTVTDANGCTASDTVEVLAVGTQDLNPLVRLQVFPNPTAQWLQIEGLNLNMKEYKVLIINALGEIVLKKTNLETSERIEVGQLPKGLYFLQIVNAEQQLIGQTKFLKN